MLNNELNLSEKSQQVQKMFDKISHRYDFLNRLLSFGQDLRWRKNLLQKIPLIKNKQGVLYDVACGTGDIIYSLLKQRSDYKTVIGFDISQGMLKRAQMRTRSSLVKHILASAEELPAAQESADCVTIAFGLRNVDNREKALREFHRVLKPGGTLIILEFFPTKSSVFQTLFNFYFNKILPQIGGLLCDKSAYSYLPKSVNSMPTPQEFTSVLNAIGFTQIECQSWLSGSTMLFHCIKK